MELLTLPRLHRDARRLVLPALLFVCLASLPSVFAARRVEGLPPADFVDEVHVPNGCYLSAVTFLRKFSAAYPAEHGRVIGFTPAGWSGGHFVAVVTWQGKWWVRDEYFGVFPANLAVGVQKEEEQFRQAVAASFNRYTQEYLKRGRLPSIPWDPRKLTSAQRVQGVNAAAGILPFESELFWVKSGKTERPFLFFRPADGQIAVYEPSNGTALAHCRASDPALVVAAVASRLGFKVDTIRPALPAPAALVAAN